MKMESWTRQTGVCELWRTCQYYPLFAQTEPRLRHFYCHVNRLHDIVTPPRTKSGVRVTQRLATGTTGYSVIVATSLKLTPGTIGVSILTSSSVAHSLKLATRLTGIQLRDFTGKEIMDGHWINRIMSTEDFKNQGRKTTTSHSNGWSLDNFFNWA